MYEEKYELKYEINYQCVFPECENSNKEEIKVKEDSFEEIKRKDRNNLFWREAVEKESFDEWLIYGKDVKCPYHSDFFDWLDEKNVESLLKEYYDSPFFGEDEWGGQLDIELDKMWYEMVLGDLIYGKTDILDEEKCQEGDEDFREWLLGMFQEEKK